MSIIGSNILAGASGQATGYNINNSLRYRGSNSAYLSRTNTTNTSLNTWTWSAWVKRGTITSSALQMLSAWTSSSTNNQGFGFATNDTFCIYNNATTASPSAASTAVFRDPAAWYHVVVKSDGSTTVGYINGTQVVSYSGTIANFQLASNILVISGQWSRTGSTNSLYFDGYMTEINFIDGQALTPSSFGNTNSTTGVWQPAKYTGTYGNNGFYLNFNSIALTSGSNTGLGKDNSGNGNYWNTNNISVTAGTTYDAMTDVPTLTSATVANYCVLNPLNKDTSITVTDGNIAASAAGTNIGVTGSIAISSGKWYWEITQTAGGVATSNIVGITDATLAAKTAGLTTNSYGYGTGTTAYKWNAGTNTAYGVNWTNGDVIGVAFDADAGTLTFYKNNSSQGTAFTGISGTFYPAFGFQSGSAYAVNFGQRPFSYTPPTGFVALNTYNLPTPTILQGNKYMDATLYTGNGSTQTIVNQALFKPDFVWIKNRSSTRSHLLYDSVRGAGLVIQSNSTNAEQGNSGDLLASFNSNGFTVNNTFSSGTNDSSNGSALTFVGWQWQAGQGSTSSNTSGSITSTVSVNATAGFSVATFSSTSTNATIGHGLGVAPKMIIVKGRNNVQDWYVYHASLGAGNYILLNSTAASAANTNLWQNTTPTSSVFYFGSSFGTVNYVAYCWAEIAGFSKFTSYTGNGSADGPFVYCGFRPKFVIIKMYSGAVGQSWALQDTSRSTYNASVYRLQAESSNAENSSTSNSIDILSNGFKIRTTDNEYNNSSYSYIVAAFAESPFKSSLAR